jgi:uncharacterized protein
VAAAPKKLDVEPIVYIILLAGGLIAGIINAVAGGGSLITLPLLIFAGLPPTVANGTNRVAVVVQSLAAVGGFQRSKKIPWRTSGTLAVPAIVGSLLGAGAASVVSDEMFRPILAGVLLVMATVVAIRPERWIHPPDAPPPHPGLRAWLLFVVIGAYGGFIQAGVGFLLLAGLVPGLGLDLVRANGVKVVLALALTAIALVVFAAGSLIDWRAGLVLAAGSGLGGYLGARLAVRHGAGWIRWVLVVTVTASALEILGVRAAIFG